jgi:4'-phosphopantetheinyl transferase
MGSLMKVYWLEQTEADVPVENAWLSSRELLRLNSMRFVKRRTDWRLGRWTAKNAVASYLKLPAEFDSLAEIEILSASSGAPGVFFANRPANVTISVSHRNGTAACAVVAGFEVPLGCDLETIEPRSDAFLNDYFTVEEQCSIGDGADRDLAVALLWSAKESALKALGAGLRLDTRCVVVRLGQRPSEHGVWSPLQVRHAGGQVFKGWWQQSGALIRTVVADPAPVPPILLQAPSEMTLEKTRAILHRGSAGMSLA